MSRSARIVLLPLLMFAFAAPAAAQWYDGFAPPGVDDTNYQAVLNVIRAEDGYIYVGGDFDLAGGEPAGNIARFDGLKWDTMDGGVNGQVFDIEIAETAVFAVGSFTEAGGTPVSFVAKYQNGQWYRMGDHDFDGPIHSITYHNAALHIGGRFWNYNGSLTGPVACWFEGDWVRVDSDWELSCTYCYPLCVYALKSFAGDLWAGGTFDRIGSHWYANIAKWNSVDGWRMGGNGISGIEGFYDKVTALATSGVSLYIAGPFAYVENELTQGLSWASYGGDLHTVSDYSDDEPEHGTYMINDVCDWNGSLYAASSQWVARYHPMNGWSRHLGEESQVDCLASTPDYLYAGINILHGYNFMDVIARWDGNGWRRCGGGLSGTDNFNDYGLSLCTWNGDIVAGCSQNFSTLSDDPEHYRGKCYGIARWHNHNWLPFDNGLTSDVKDVIVYDGDLYACGRFDWASGAENPGFAVWDTESESWSAPGGGLDGLGEGEAMCVWRGDLIIGGTFSGAGGVTTDNLVAFDGAAYSPVAAATPGGRVKALCVFENDLIVGGTFTDVDGNPAGHVARFDGETWTYLDGGTSTGWVEAVAEWGGDLYMGGTFDDAGGAPAAKVARWDGSAWTTLGDGLYGEAAQSGAYALIGTSAGLFVGGHFETAGGLAAMNVARWTGTEWEALGDGITDEGDGHALVHDFLVHNNELYMTGDFDHAGSHLSINIARWREEMTPVALQAFTAEQTDRGVELFWRSHDDALAEFRLTAELSGREWRPDYERVAPAAYRALDRSPHLDAGGLVTYSLEGRLTGEDWEILRQESVHVEGRSITRAEMGLYPNPANPTMRLELAMPLAGPAEVAVYDVAGRRVRLLHAGRLDAGPFELAWNGRDDAGSELASGVYLIRFTTRDETLTRRAVLLR